MSTAPAATALEMAHHPPAPPSPTLQGMLPRPTEAAIEVPTGLLAVAGGLTQPTSATPSARGAALGKAGGTESDLLMPVMQRDGTTIPIAATMTAGIFANATSTLADVMHLPVPTRGKPNRAMEGLPVPQHLRLSVLRRDLLSSASAPRVESCERTPNRRTASQSIQITVLKMRVTNGRRMLHGRNRPVNFTAVLASPISWPVARKLPASVTHRAQRRLHQLHHKSLPLVSNRGPSTVPLNGVWSGETRRPRSQLRRAPAYPRNPPLRNLPRLLLE